MRRVIGGWLLGGGVLVSSSLLSAQAPSAACGEPTWSPARPLMREGTPLYVEGGRGVRVTTGIAYVGTTSWWMTPRRPLDPAVSLLPTSKDSVRLLAHFGAAGIVLHAKGSSSFIASPLAHPTAGLQDLQVVQGRDGVAHVVWAMGLPGTLGRRRVMPMRTLWYAQFDGTTWSAAEQVYAAFHIEWAAQYTASAVTGDGRPLLVIGAYDSAGTDPRYPGTMIGNARAVILQRSTTGQWTKTTFPVERMTTPTISSTATGAPLVAYIGEPSRDQRQGVYVVRTRADDKGWGPSSPRQWGAAVPVTVALVSLHAL